MTRAKKRSPLSDGSPRRVIRSKTAFGRRFTKWLQERGVRTMAEAGRLVGFSTHSVTMWRRGDRVPGRLARAALEDMMSGRVTPPGARRRT